MAVQLNVWVKFSKDDALVFGAVKTATKSIDADRPFVAHMFLDKYCSSNLGNSTLNALTDFASALPRPHGSNIGVGEGAALLVMRAAKFQNDAPDLAQRV